MTREAGKVLKFRLVPADSNSHAAAEFLRGLADLCDANRVDALAVFYCDSDEDEKLFRFHHLAGNLSDVTYAMDLAKHEWLKGALA